MPGICLHFVPDESSHMSSNRPLLSSPCLSALTRLICGATATCAMMLTSVTAHAGGFEVAGPGARALGRGNAYVVGAKDLSAIYYNPALLAKQRGTKVMLSHSLIWHQMEYTRAPLSDFWVDPQTGEALGGTTFDPVKNQTPLFALGGFGVISSDFGLDNWTFAAGMYGPHAVGKVTYPEYGPQSFLLTEMDTIVLYYSLAAAWKHKSDKFGFGATAQWADMPYLSYSLGVDSSLISDSNPDNGVDASIFAPLPRADGTQLVTKLNLQDRFAFTAILGAWYRPLPSVEFGLAGRVVPVVFRPEGVKKGAKKPFLAGKGTWSGSLETDKETLVSESCETDPMTGEDINCRPTSASMDKLVMPIEIRVGARYIKTKGDQEQFDVELDVQYENWSANESFDITFDGAINGIPIAPISIKKNFKDTVAIRVGGDYNLLEGRLSLRAGGFFETAASPDAYAHLDIPSFMRGGLSAGLSGQIRGVGLNVGYMHVFQDTVETNEATAKLYQIRAVKPCPDYCGGENGVRSNAGTFKSSFDIFGASIELLFEEMIHGDKWLERRADRKAARKAKKSPASQL